ncbi:RDD domain-containing protein [Bacillus sp. 1NLA3E]|nr:RDD domain-containing protein [Bacillus sp. 1NLA3E]
MISNPAGFWRRLLANILDGIIISFPISLICNFIFRETSANVVSSILDLLYALLIPVIWSGFTVGKRIAGIRIARVNGESVGIVTMLLRSLVGAIVYTVTLGIGIIVSAFMVGIRQDKRSIHDFIAGTYVTRD